MEYLTQVLGSEIKRQFQDIYNSIPRKFKVISWIHNHPNKSGFSENDLQTQIHYSSHFPGIFATLYVHGSHRYDSDHKMYELNPDGVSKGNKILQFSEEGNEPASFEIVPCSSPINIHDARDMPDESNNEHPVRKYVFASNGCRCCKKRFPDEKALLHHVSRAKKCMSTYSAELANFKAYVKMQEIAALSTRAQEAKHKSHKLEKRSSKEEESGKSFSCPTCNATFAWKKSRDRHIRNMHSSSAKPIKCTECEKTFSRVEHMKEHLRCVHAETILECKCKICGKLFKQEQHLTRHMKEVHYSVPTDMVKCPDCHKTFKRKENMTDHWQFWHSGDETQYRCKICGKIFTKERNCDRHLMEVHLTDWHLMCEQCPASYTRKENLDQHIKAGIHWQHVYCHKCEQVLKFETKNLRNKHCIDHGMPEKCVELEPHERPEET